MSKTYTGILAIAAVLVLFAGGAFLLLKNSSQSPAVNPNRQIPSELSTNQVQTSTSQTMDNSTASPDSSKNQIVLSITSPADRTIVSANKLTLTGKTVPDADVSVNDQDLVADSKGNFSAVLTLDEGDNPIEVTASDNNGNASILDITVSYQPAGQ